MQVRVLGRLAKEHASMAGGVGIMLRQDPVDQTPRLNERYTALPQRRSKKLQPFMCRD